MTLQLHHKTLGNGLTVLAETNTEAHTCAIGFFVKTGARDEQPALMGVSHFLEHMMFKGTPRRTAADVNRQFDEIGANYNAYTSHENTVYFAQVLPKFLPDAVDLLGDMLRPSLRQEDFDVEKNVILEEIGMYEDQPFSRLTDQLLEMHFGGHGMGYRVLGTADSVSQLGVEQMRAYFDERYSPDNIVVAAAGQLDFEKLLDDVSNVAESWKATGATRDYSEASLQAGQQVIEDERVTRHYIEMIFPGPSAQDARRYAASVLADVIGDSEGSRLYWALIDPGLADEADMHYYPHDHIGSFMASASCAADRAEQVESLLVQTIDGYVDSIDPMEIQRAKNKIATQLTLRTENPLGCMRKLGGQWLYLGKYVPLDEQLEMLMSVTGEDIKSLIEQVPFEPRTVISLKPASTS